MFSYQNKTYLNRLHETFQIVILFFFFIKHEEQYIEEHFFVYRVDMNLKYIFCT